MVVRTGICTALGREIYLTDDLNRPTLTLMAITIDIKVASNESLGTILANERDRCVDSAERQEAFYELYQRNAQRLLAFLCSRVSRSDAEDIAQSVWQRVWEKIPNEFTQGGFRGWLFTVARRRIVDEYRKRKPEELSPDFVPIDEDAGDALVAEELKNALAACIDALESNAAEIVRARLAGENYETICERMCIQAPKAHKVFHNAKTRLSECVESKVS